MKILFYDYYRYFSLISNEKNEVHGGFTKQLRGWLEGFINNGWNVGVMVLNGQKEILEKSHLNYDYIETYDQNIGLKYFRYISIRIPSYLKVIKIYKPDFLFLGGADFHVAILFSICKLLKIKTIYRPTNDIEFDDRLHSRKKYLNTYLFKLGRRLSDFIICQNDYQYNKSIKLYPKKNVLKIQNPIITNNNTKSFVKGDYVSWLGIFQKQKNLELLIEIIKKCPEIKFKIAGKPKERENYTTSLIAELNRLQNVELIGYLNQKEIPQFLGESFCHLNTSHYEGFSNTFLESWLVGTLVLSPEYINPDSIITNHELGAIFNDVDECVKLIYDFKSININDYNKISLRLTDYINHNHSNINLTRRLIEKLAIK